MAPSEKSPAEKLKRNLSMQGFYIDDEFETDDDFAGSSKAKCSKADEDDVFGPSGSGSEDEKEDDFEDDDDEEEDEEMDDDDIVISGESESEEELEKPKKGKKTAAPKSKAATPKAPAAPKGKVAAPKAPAAPKGKAAAPKPPAIPKKAAPKAAPKTVKSEEKENAKIAPATQVRRSALSKSAVSAKDGPVSIGAGGGRLRMGLSKQGGLARPISPCLADLVFMGGIVSRCCGGGPESNGRGVVQGDSSHLVVEEEPLSDAAAADGQPGVFSPQIGGMPLQRVRFAWKAKEPLTLKELEHKKRTFWDTCKCFGGDAQIWGVLEVVCLETYEDIALCRSLLEGCGVILPTGSLTEIYDTKGFRYRLPLFCICEPVNLENDSGPASDDIKSKDSRDVLKPDAATDVHVRLSSGQDVCFELDSKSKIQQLKLLLRPKTVTVLWRGKILSDDVVLQSLGLTSKDLLQAFVHDGE